LHRATVKIMALDDEPFILKLHARMLADLGFVACRVFENGHEALEDLARGPAPDLILLDLSMPRMDGIEFIRHLVKLEFHGSLLLVSGEDERMLLTAERLVQAHGIAVLGHLSKPVKPAGLRAMLEEWERRTGSTPRPPGRSYTALEVSEGLGRGEFINHYQPKVSLSSGEITGVECLARWQHPEEGLVMPAHFISVAESHGLIEEMTRVTFRRAMDEIRDVEAAGLPLQVSVNLAASVLTSLDFADFAVAEVQRACLSPRQVVLEVTESELMKDLRAPLEVLSRLRLMRFVLSIDDFGTGYSSLAQLRDIPFDELKIDQSFVHRAAHDPTARAMYDTSLSLAKRLHLRTVAEGVENQADWDLVQSTACDEAQGYLVARPMEASSLPGFRDDWRARSATQFAFRG
jgi:EAL domain-containing protein (putative c-di-GMP-specific phosphodiesterase class I)/ActR/RegA family two-component response regulator